MNGHDFTGKTPAVMRCQRETKNGAIEPIANATGLQRNNLSGLKHRREIARNRKFRAETSCVDELDIGPLIRVRDAHLREIIGRANIPISLHNHRPFMNGVTSNPNERFWLNIDPRALHWSKRSAAEFLCRRRTPKQRIHNLVDPVLDRTRSGGATKRRDVNGVLCGDLKDCAHHIGIGGVRTEVGQRFL